VPRTKLLCARQGNRGSLMNGNCSDKYTHRCFFHDIFFSFADGRFAATTKRMDNNRKNKSSKEMMMMTMAIVKW
jgi:hypothetical protein